ncbi:Holliday junction resolvase RuvX [Synechococcus sp. CS-1325]|nr:Holliday junction resolvase RuvX [Synechococcus sp. CS-1325]MCT0213349.1 Holliday junction resolvase RuvX [Synechococcus sp. CS-1326]MCT0231586.1 Holliday junction resolvase RuvX [Synechococcus sp. CS-1324]MCT0232797.1 Holliday junction resolvase RuvX [Synechococcus sp. CS-1327]PZV00321.1 MAG: Holliday junction resolvase RuvX [Cyanobium sp.]
MLTLDVGRRRIGLAGCDPLGLTVIRLPALLRRSLEEDLQQLLPLIQQRQVTALVVGLPLDSRQRPTPQALHCRRYGESLARALDLPLAWVNEYGSSWEAGERHGLHGDRSGRLDSAAAALLLQQWLSEGPEPGPVRLSTQPGGQPADAATS